METRKCVQCDQPNPRANAETCSPRCYQAHKTRTVAKQCLVCGVDYFARGKTCSKAHAMELKKQTNRELFGADWAIQTDDAKKKRVETSMERYGVPHHLQAEASLAKLRETSRKTYGTDYPNQNSEVKKRIEDKMLERYGVDNAFKSDEVKAKIEATMIERYGEAAPMHNEVIRDKVREAIQRRYGVDNPFQAKEVQDKIKAIHLEKRGVEYPGQSASVQAKISETIQRKHGVDWSFQSQEVQAKIRATNLERLGFEYPTQSAEVVAKVQKTFQANVAAGLNRRSGRVSKMNQNLAATLENEYGVKVTLEAAHGPYSFDLGIDGTNICIELNPTYTHNSDRALVCSFKKCEPGCGHAATARDYHQKRALYARDNGLRLIQLYDWNTANAHKLLDGKLAKGFQKYSARKLTLKKIEAKEANRFLSANHSQGAVQGQTHCYGLFDGDTPLAVATFGKSRFKAKAEYEFIRYAVQSDVIIHGASGRLFQAFAADATPETVISYVDFDHSTGPSFLTGLGFDELKPTAPALVWSKGSRRVNQNSLLAQGADRLLGTAYGDRKQSGLNNEEIMAAEGFQRVFTSGNRVFLWNK